MELPSYFEEMGDIVPLLSIRPIHSKEIFDGRKKVELRKKVPKMISNYLLVYESSPTQEIKGLIKIKDINCLGVNEIIIRYSKKARVSPEFISEYYKEHKRGYVIEIEESFEFSSPVPLDILREKIDFTPPQNYMYFNTSILMD